MNTRKFATTVRLNRDKRYVKSAHIIDIPEPWSAFNYRFVDEIRIFLAVLNAARYSRTLLIFSSRGRFKPELLAAIIIGFWPRKFRPQIAMYGEMYQPDTGIAFIVQRIAMRMADCSIARYIIGSHAEVAIFSRLWNISPDKIRVCHEYTRVRGAAAAIKDKQEVWAEPKHTYIFAGGNSFRNFEPLIEVARRRPQVMFRFGTSQLQNRSDIPPNIVTGLVPPELYKQLIQDAAAVIVPIADDVKRIVGALTYLEAMAYGKFVIVTDALGAAEYIQHGDSGYIVDGSVESYLKAIDFVLNPSSRPIIEDISNRAREVSHTNFSKNIHIDRLLEIMDEFISEEVNSPRVQHSGHEKLIGNRKSYRSSKTV